jgi:hypothetical protein
MIMKKLLPVIVLSVVAAMTVTHLVLLDGLGGAIWALLGEDTLYTTEYSSLAFRGVRLGDTADKVRSQLGDPMETFGMKKVDSADDGWLYRLSDSDAEGWSYSRSPGSDSYRIRVVVLKNRRVVDKVAKFYVD